MTSEVLVYAAAPVAQTMRLLLGTACQATGLTARLELYATGSLYQRLGPRHAPPLPDVVVWFGPFAAQAAALDGLLQSYQPAQTVATAAHDPAWRWTTLDYLRVGVLGASPAASLTDLASVPSLAIADPERSEVGLSMLLATLDRARQVEADVEKGWAWWNQRVRRGLTLAEDDPGAVGMVADTKTTHALSLSPNAAALNGVAPVPNAIGLAASSRNVEAARHVVDWLTSQAAGAMLALSPWQAASNGLQALQAGAPALDVDWARQQYSEVRRRWGQSGFGPTVKE